MLFESRSLYRAVLGVLGLAATGAAVAQQEVASVRTLDTVVVTAQKREESVQSVPLPVSVIGGEKLLGSDILTANDITRLIPNISGQSSGGRRERPRWFIRGIGSNDPSNTVESPIGIYQDEVFVSLTALQGFPIFDLERVEVLRGPQGTLWGKNTTGGAINYISRKPSFDTDGYLRLSAGSYGTKGVQGAFGGPINDLVAARASFFYETQDGFARNLATGKDSPTLDDQALRLQLLHQITPNLEALFNIHFRKLDAESNPFYPINTGAGGVDSNGWAPSYGTSPDPTDDFYAGESDNVDDVYGVLLKLDWQLGDYTLTSISAFDEIERRSDVGAGNPPTLVGSRDVTATHGELGNWQISQELRLASPKDQFFSWIAGFHYFKQDLSEDSASATFDPAPRRTWSYTWLDQESESYAVFGNARFAFTDRFALSVGLRWTEEEKAINIHTIRSSGATFNNVVDWWRPASLSSPYTYDVDLSRDNEWSELTGDITPEYQLTDNVLLYFRYARGYRSGGFNNSIPVLSAGQIAAGITPYIPEVDPEYLDDYEFGLKSQWLDGRLTVNAGLFYYDQKDIQLNIQAPNPLNLQNPPTGSFAQNAASGTVNGFELEIQALPLDNLQVGVSLGLLDTEYEDFYPTLSVSGVTSVVDRSGNEYFRSPKTTATLDLQYSIPLSGGGTIVLGTDWSYRSHVYFNAAIQGAEQGDTVAGGFVSEKQEQDGYVLGNARVSYITTDDKVEYFASVNNITDETYSVVTLVPSPNYRTQLGNPRTWLVGATLRF